VPIGANVYERGVYALLSGSTQLPTSDKAPGFSQQEDFLFGGLWSAIIGASCTEPSHEGNSAAFVADKVEALGRTIVQWGPARFDDHRSEGGWAYAIALLATQQYRRAIAHLIHTGHAIGLMEATHIGMVFDAIGIPIEETASIDIVSTAGIDSLQVRPSTTRVPGNTSSAKPTVTKLIVEYAKRLQEVAVVASMSDSSESWRLQAAIEYMARIPDRASLCREISNLVALTKADSILVGRLSPVDGQRVEAALDLYLDASTVSSILNGAAQVLLQTSTSNSDVKRRLTMAAVGCFMLGGMYGDMFAVLNSVLAPPSETSGDRSFWIDQTKGLWSTYLSTRTPVVARIEESEEWRGMMKTNSMVLELNAFFDLVRQHQHSDARKLIENLSLVSATEVDLASKEKFYVTLDPLVRDSYPEVLATYTGLLYHEYTRVRREYRGTGVTTSVLDQRLRDLKNRAKLQVALAGLLGFHGPHKQELTQFEMLMV
jgi:Nup93/Nic96